VKPKSIRVIAGSLKGRRLQTPTWEALRPTSDKLRETLFNVVAPRVRGARVLDGYAGTGALGIEAISRGAAQVTFVERDRRAQALIAANLAHCGIAGGYVIIRASFARALANLTGVSFDLVLLDPPYDEAVDEPITTAARRLTPGGLLVLEHARRRDTPAAAGGLVRTRQVISGDSALSLYETGLIPWDTGAC
jgi:16S rRNA (guanine966-N2)-methyltransferase